MKLAAVCAVAVLGVAVGDVWPLTSATLMLGLECVAAAWLVAAMVVGPAPGHAGWRLAAVLACAAALGFGRASLAASAETESPAAASAPGRGPPAATARAVVAPYLDTAVRAHGVLSAAPRQTRGGHLAFGLLEATITPATTTPRPPPTARPAQAVGLDQLRVVADPALELAGLAAGDQVTLEGRLRGDDAGGPPALLGPKLVEHTPAGGSVVDGRPAATGAAQAHTPGGWRDDLLGALRRARDHAQAGLHAYLPSPQAGLASGVLLGGSAGLDPTLRLQLQRAGLGHLLAIDGYKLVVVTAALSGVTVSLLGPRLAAPPVWLGVAGYTLLTGAHPSAIRAALMLGLASAAALTGRVADPLTSLALVACVMAMLEPRILLDVGLQLSLSATLGLILLWPRLRRRLRPGRRAGPIRRTLQPLLAEPAGLTLAVTLASLPVLLGAFQTVSLVSPVAHILAVPLLPAVLLSAAMLALAAPFAGVAIPLAWLAWLPTTLLLWVVEFFGSLPNAALSTGRMPVLGGLVLATGLVGWGLCGLPELRRLRRRWARPVGGRSPVPRVPGALRVGLSLLLAATTLWLVAADGRTQFAALDAGGGTAVLIREPTGRTVLFGQGRLDGAGVARQVAEHLAPWQHKLDLVVALDVAAETGLGPTLARYPADVRLTSAQLRQAGPLLEPDQDQQVQHDHDEHDDQLHPFADDHGVSLAARE